MFLYCIVKLLLGDREYFTNFVLGLYQKKRGPHAILSLCSIKSVEEWVEALPQEQKRIIKSKVPKSFQTNKINVVLDKTGFIGWEHFRIIYQHQCRYTNRFTALFQSIKRFIKAKYMIGFVDNYYVNNTLKAWTKHSIKHQTYRAMWFYQATDVSKMYIWFSTKRMIVERAIEMKCKYVDLGLTSSLGDLKENFGFIPIENYAINPKYYQGNYLLL